MNNQTQQLIDAHLQFELEQLKGNALNGGIQTELGALFQHWQTVTLEDLISAEQIISYVSRTLIPFEINTELKTSILNVIKSIDDLDVHNQADIKDLISTEHFKALILKSLNMEAPRNAIIHQILNHSLYSSLISDVLYSGIKNYLTDENSIMGKIPGMNSMMKMGKWSMNKTMPKMEDTIDRTVKSYLKGNLNASVELSERIIKETVESDSISTLIEEIWNELGEQKVSLFYSYITSSDIEDFADIILDLWQELGQTEYVANYVGELTQALYNQYKDKAVAPTLESFGLGEDYLLNQMQQYLPQLLETAAVQNYLEARVKARLERFYTSEACQNILKETAPA